MEQEQEKKELVPVHFHLPEDFYRELKKECIDKDVKVKELLPKLVIAGWEAMNTKAA